MSDAERSACFSAFPPWLALVRPVLSCERLAADLPPARTSATCTRNVWSRRHYNSPFSHRPGAAVPCAERFWYCVRGGILTPGLGVGTSQEASRGSRGRPISDISPPFSRGQTDRTPEAGRASPPHAPTIRGAAARNEAAPWKQRARRSRRGHAHGKPATGAAFRRSVCLQSSAVDPRDSRGSCVGARIPASGHSSRRGSDTYLIGGEVPAGEPGTVR